VDRRRAFEHRKGRRISERRACRLIGCGPLGGLVSPEGCDDTALRARPRALAERYPRYGYPTLHDMLKAEPLVVNPKRTYRIYREEGLQVRIKRRKKLNRPLYRGKPKGGSNYGGTVTHIPFRDYNI
jgi:putative transposase